VFSPTALFHVCCHFCHICIGSLSVERFPLCLYMLKTVVFSFIYSKFECLMSFLCCWNWQF